MNNKTTIARKIIIIVFMWSLIASAILVLQTVTNNETNDVKEERIKNWNYCNSITNNTQKQDACFEYYDIFGLEKFDRELYVEKNVPYHELKSGLLFSLSIPIIAVTIFGVVGLTFYIIGE